MLSISCCVNESLTASSVPLRRSVPFAGVDSTIKKIKSGVAATSSASSSADVMVESVSPLLMAKTLLFVSTGAANTAPHATKMRASAAAIEKIRRVLRFICSRPWTNVSDTQVELPIRKDDDKLKIFTEAAV